MFICTPILLSVSCIVLHCIVCIFFKDREAKFILGRGGGGGGGGGLKFQSPVVTIVGLKKSLQ